MGRYKLRRQQAQTTTSAFADHTCYTKLAIPSDKLRPGEAAKAKVEIHVRYHGPASRDADQLESQLSNWGGGCESGANPNPLPTDYKCWNPQRVIFEGSQIKRSLVTAEEPHIVPNVDVALVQDIPGSEATLQRFVEDRRLQVDLSSHSLPSGVYSLSLIHI